MVTVLFTRYLISDSRILRFSKELKLSVVPGIGADFSMHDGSYTIERVTFHDLVRDDEEWIQVFLEDEKEPDGKEYILPDSEIEYTIEEMEEYGWILQSNVKRSDTC